MAKDIHKVNPFVPIILLFLLFDLYLILMAFSTQDLGETILFSVLGGFLVLSTVILIVGGSMIVSINRLQIPISNNLGSNSEN